MEELGEREFAFDVALSFAGEDRAYVEEVSTALKAAHVRVILDSDHEAAMWGENPPEYFRSIYTERSRYTIIFVSMHYASSTWTRGQRRAALTRAQLQRPAYVLQVRLDDTVLPGLLTTGGYIDARRTGTDGLVHALRARLSEYSRVEPMGFARVPRTPIELGQLLADRPPGWEYGYFAATLKAELDLCEPKFLDQQLHYAAPIGERVEREQILPYVRRAFDDVRAIVDRFPALMDTAVLERAVGAPGESGDPVRIRLLAERLTSVYESLLDWAAHLRGVSVPADSRRLFDTLASVVDRPVIEYRDFVDDAVEQTDLLAERVTAGKPASLRLALKLTVDDAVVESFNQELGRLFRKD
ncbi:MAG: TIR domain-containing protein [Candidatus Dormibacteria bacterium]